MCSRYVLKVSTYIRYIANRSVDDINETVHALKIHFLVSNSCLRAWQVTHSTDTEYCLTDNDSFAQNATSNFHSSFEVRKRDHT